MIGVLKFLAHIFFFGLLVIYLITVNGSDMQAVGEKNGPAFKGAFWVGGIVIVLVWGCVISGLDWIKRKMGKI